MKGQTDSIERNHDAMNLTLITHESKIARVFPPCFYSSLDSSPVQEVRVLHLLSPPPVRQGLKKPSANGCFWKHDLPRPSRCS